MSDLRRRVFAPVARSWDRTVEVVHATTTGENAVRRNGSLRMDTSRWADAERWIERNGWHDEALVGIWHTHPDLTGKDASEPSDTDLRMFLAARDLTHKTRSTAYSVGLILTLRRVGGYLPEHSWLNPDVHAFVTRRSRAGTPVTERANVEGWR